MKKFITSLTSRILLFAGGLSVALLQPGLQATPYASCITNNSGAIQFHLNEGGGTVVVTYEDGSTNANFDGFTAGTNLGPGMYSFSLAGHTTYSIAVTLFGTGKTHQVDNSQTNGVANPNGSTNSMFIVGNLRGLDVNRNVTSPHFGQIYFDRSNPGNLFCLDSDGTVVVTNAAGIAWPASTFAPYRLSIASDDYLTVGSAESGTAGVYLIAPDLSTGQLLLGPAGKANGNSAGVHGLIFSRPYLVGALSTGSATLHEVDNDYPANSAQVNSDLIFSGITLGALPWQTPGLVGPQIGLGIVDLENVYPGISRNPNGYFYFSEQRGNCAIPDVYVFDSTVSTLLWQSTIVTNVSDRFVVAGNGCIDVQCSPDGKYLAGVTANGYIVICSLTNGIPDAATFVINTPPTLGANGSLNSRGIAWDVADNFYTISTLDALVHQWTLGQSTTATTTGNAGGVTGFNLTSLIPVISLSATPLISQANSYGNPTNGVFTLTRSGGNLAAPLTVNFTYAGTATNGTYTTSAASSITFAAGQTSTNISITAVTDGQPRPTTALTLKITIAPISYSVLGSGQTTMQILNTATPYMIASVGAPSAYNAFSNDYASVVVTRWGDTNTSESVSSFTVAGTGTQGTDYTAPTPVTFNPGDLTQKSYIYPLIAGNPPTHSASLAFTGNKTAIIGIGSGSGYLPAPNTATLTIIDSALPPENVLFADPLTDPNDATNWGITGVNGNILNVPVDLDPEFGWDLVGNSFPLPPSGATTALRLTVNKGSGQGGTAAMTAMNAYLTNHVFSGNYAVRFNMNVIETGNFVESGSFNNEEGALFGINHNGIETNWFAGGAFAVGAPTTFAADGIFFWVSDSGGRFDNSFTPYEGFVGNGSPATNTGWAFIGSLGTAPFANVFKTNVFTSPISTFVSPFDSGWTEGGPGLAANGSASYGLSQSSWSDVEIKQLNGVVTMSIDKTPIFVYTNISIFTSGLVMLGYEDPYNGGEDNSTAVYYSNLRVVSVGGPVITNVGLDNVHGNVVLDFSVTDDGGTFTVQGAANIKGPYANVAAATITSLGGGAFQVTAPKNGAVQFYRVLQQ